MTNSDEVRQRLEMLADDELVSILQDRDMEEWRPEVFDIVASLLKARGISPGEAIEPEEEPIDEAESQDLVTVARYLSALEANIDRMALEEGGLKAWIIDEYAPQLEGYHMGVRLQVRAEDFTTAMGILQSDAAPSSVLPPEIAEPPFPKCGSREVIEIAEIAEVLDSSGTMVSSSDARCGSTIAPLATTSGPNRNGRVLTSYPVGRLEVAPLYYL